VPAVNQTTSVQSTTSLLNQFKLPSHVCCMFWPLFGHLQLRQHNNIYPKISYLPVYVLVLTSIVPSCICSCVGIYCTFLYMFLCWHLLHLTVYVLVLTSIVPSCICSFVGIYCTFLYYVLVLASIVPSCICSCVGIYYTFLYMFLCWHLLYLPVYVLVLASIAPFCICSCVGIY